MNMDQSKRKVPKKQKQRSSTSRFQRLNISSLDNVPGITDVSRIPNITDLDFTLSSSSEDEGLYVPNCDTFACEEALIAIQDKADTKLEKLLICTKEDGEEYKEIILQDKTETKQSYKATMCKLKEKMEQLKEEDIQTSTELKSLEKQLEELKIKKLSSLKKAKTEYGKATTQLAKVEKKLEHRRTISRSQRRFMEKLGVKFGFSRDEVHKSLGFKMFEDEECFLYFSELNLPKFKVERAIPNFKEFEQLAEEVNKSGDFLKLLCEARHCFDRDSRVKAQQLKDFLTPPNFHTNITSSMRK